MTLIVRFQIHWLLLHCIYIRSSLYHRWFIYQRHNRRIQKQFLGTIGNIGKGTICTWINHIKRSSHGHWWKFWKWVSLFLRVKLWWLNHILVQKLKSGISQTDIPSRLNQPFRARNMPMELAFTWFRSIFVPLRVCAEKYLNKIRSQILNWNIFFD